MLVSFSIENFRSFLAEETLSLVASKKLTGCHDGHLFEIPNTKESALRSAVIYGANGAGKSNLFRALKFVKTMVTKTRPNSIGTGRQAFKFNTDAGQPTSFDLQFIASGKLYRYGFRLNDEHVTEEWLALTHGEKEKTIFERLTHSNGSVQVNAPGIKKDNEKIKLLATIGGPANQTFLATIKSILKPEECSDDIRATISWFNSTLRLIAPDEAINPIGHMLSTDGDFLDFAGKFLKSSSTGVDHLEVNKTEVTEEELSRLISRPAAEKMLEDIKSSESGTAILQYGEGMEIVLERKDAAHYYRVTVQAAHQNPKVGTVKLDLEDESDGTRRLLQLVPALHLAQAAEVVYFIDEIDRSMHPMLIWKFLDFFLKSCSDKPSQLLVTTHESNLLDLELLRRDEIIFIEKDETLASKIYSLSDFKVRKDLEVRKHYLQGRFGAVPFLGSIDRLMESAEH